MNKNTYFLSDFHLGMPNLQASHNREQLICAFLDTIKNDAESIYLVGDVFDFWFEYKTVIPKGFIRIMGKLASLKEAGINIYMFTGNHDLWMKDYFTQELDIPVYTAPIIRNIQGKNFYIGHGDGLGPGDTGYKIMKKIFTNPVCRWLFSWIHPDIGIGIASFWSHKSRLASNEKEEKSFGKDEWLLLYAQEVLKTQAIDYFIFGHRHLPLSLPVNNGAALYINLGDWLKYNTYAVFNGTNAELKYYNSDK